MHTAVHASAQELTEEKKSDSKPVDWLGGQAVQLKLTVEAVVVGDLGHDGRVKAAQEAKQDALLHARVVLVAAEVLPVDRPPHPRRRRPGVPFRKTTGKKKNGKTSYNHGITAEAPECLSTTNGK